MFSVCSMFYSMYWMKIIHKICQNQIYRNIYYENNQKLLSKNSQPLLNFLFPWFRNRFGWSCRTKKNYWNVYIYAYLRASNDFSIKMSLNYSASYDNLSTILLSKFDERRFIFPSHDISIRCAGISAIAMATVVYVASQRDLL